MLFKFVFNVTWKKKILVSKLLAAISDWSTLAEVMMYCYHDKLSYFARGLLLARIRLKQKQCKTFLMLFYYVNRRGEGGLTRLLLFPFPPTNLCPQ